MSWSKATKHTSFPSNATLTEKQNRDLILQFQNDQPKPEDFNYDAKQYAFACSEYWKNMANFVSSAKLQSNDSKPLVSLNIDSIQGQNNDNKAKNLIGFRDDSNSNNNNNNQKSTILHSSAPTIPLSHSHSAINSNNNINISPRSNTPNRPVSSAPTQSNNNNNNVNSINSNISPRSYHNRPVSSESKPLDNINSNTNNNNSNNSSSLGPSLTSGNRMAFRKSSAQKDGIIPSQMASGRTHSKGISLGVNKVSLGMVIIIIIILWMLLLLFLFSYFSFL